MMIVRALKSRISQALSKVSYVFTTHLKSADSSTVSGQPMIMIPVEGSGFLGVNLMVYVVKVPASLSACINFSYKRISVLRVF